MEMKETVTYLRLLQLHHLDVSNRLVLSKLIMSQQKCLTHLCYAMESKPVTSSERRRPPVSNGGRQALAALSANATAPPLSRMAAGSRFGELQNTCETIIFIDINQIREFHSLERISSSDLIPL